jgi:hypothetical protein
VFKDLYANRWSQLIKTNYFKESLVMIYSSKRKKQAEQLILSFFNNGLNPSETKINIALKEMVIKRSIAFQLKYIYDKIKFGVYRRIGRYENYRTVK